MFTLAAITALAWGFTKIQVFDYANLDRAILANNPRHFLKLELPEVGREVYERNDEVADHRYHIAGPVYVGIPKDVSSIHPKMYYLDHQSEIQSTDELLKHLENDWTSYMEFDRVLLQVQLFADRDVPMKYINEVKIAAGNLGLRKIMIAVKNDSIKLSHQNKYYVRQMLPWCEQLSGNTFCYDDFLPTDGRAVHISIRKNEVYYDGKRVSPDSVHSLCMQFILANPKNALIRMHVDQDSHLSHYLKVFTTLRNAISDVRDHVVSGKHGYSWRQARRGYQASRDSHDEEAYKFGLSEVTSSLIELSDVARNNLLKKRPDLVKFLP